MPTCGNELVISDSWYEDTSWQSAGSREFLASAELWCPAKLAAGSVRKPQLPRKATEKRDSIGTVLSGDERKLREKPSWFRSHVNSSTANGSWRPARCKLTEEHDRCTLNIYVDETILQYSIYVHLLRCTDVRPADRSLFFRNDCLGIHVKAGQRWLDTNTEEVVYLKFPSSGAINTWVALLRSYAVAEIYGRNHAPIDGGLYRMWRQVQLEVSQARNLGTAKSLSEFVSIPMTGADNDATTDGVDIEVSCEIVINDILCGRTTVKKSTGAPEWHEKFIFSDLPPFGDLLIHVYREKKVFKPHLLGTVQIVLSNFRRGEMLEGWFPVISTGQSITGAQVGELRLRMKVDEEIVLPTASYAPILQCMAKGNLLDLLFHMEQELKLGHTAEHVMAIAVGRNVLMRDLFELAEREVGGTSSSQNTLFRGNTVLTKTIEHVMNWFGKSFLEASVGPVVRRLVSEKIAIEVDPIRSGKGLKDQEKNVDLLVQWCTEFWNNIYSVREECPQELRQIFQHIRQLVEKRFETSNRDMRWQSVSAFCFLRFIVPSILHPHLFGLCHGMPSAPIQRSLTLIAKVLQSLANLNPTVQKEEYMRGVKIFLKDSLPAMIDYIKEVSTPSPEQFRDCSPTSADKHDRIQVMNALRERKPTMPTLHREALLFLPHLLDIPKHLAILTSAVVRSTKYQRGRGPDNLSEPLGSFTRSCLEVEGVALRCVTQLGRPRKHGNRSQSFAHTNSSHHQTFSQAGSSQISPGGPDDNTLYTGKKRMTLRAGRPSTAPSTPDSDRQGSWRNWDNSVDDSPLPSSPVLESMPRTSSGSGHAYLPSSSLNAKRSTSLDKAKSSEENSRNRRRPLVSDDTRVGTLDPTFLPAEDASDSVATTDASDDGKKRKRFLPGFLTKR
ncbi:GTPase activating protein [Phellopilus nigrolimitatus]|nr:GTPase activating protein [Phellopilus nigrolimitatus]